MYSESKILTGNLIGKRLLGRPRREVIVRMDLKEIGISARKCVNLTQIKDYWRAFVNAALNHWVS